MDLSEVARALPTNVALVALESAEQPAFEIFVEEEQLLSASTSPQKAAGFRLGRRAAHLALEAIGYRPQPVLRGPRREPIWPDGVTGSITHAGDHVIAVVAHLSDAGGIGIDLEDRSRYFPELEAEVTVEAELIALDRMEGGRREDATIEIFSAKESIFKAHYPRIGQYFGFDAARIELDNDHLVGYFTETLDPLYPVGRPMKIGRFWAGEHVLTWLVLPPDDQGP